MASTDARKQLLYALWCVLRPIVRILIRAGIRFDEFAEIARAAYIGSPAKLAYRLAAPLALRHTIRA